MGPGNARSSATLTVGVRGPPARRWSSFGAADAAVARGRSDRGDGRLHARGRRLAGSSTRDLLRARSPAVEAAGSSADDDEHPRAEKSPVPSARAASETRPDVPPVHARRQPVRPSGESPPLAKCDVRPTWPGTEHLPVVPPKLNVVVRRATNARPAKHRRPSGTGTVERRDEP